MYNDFKTTNYANALVSPELWARHLSRMYVGENIDGFTVIPGTGLQVVLEPGNSLVRYGSANVASARMVSLVANFNLTVTTPDASNPRIDLVVIYTDNGVTLASNTADGQGASKAMLVAGTPNASPSAPNGAAIQAAVGSGNPYSVKAEVRVEAGVSTIAANKITDVRAPFGSSTLGVSYRTSDFLPGTTAETLITSLNTAVTIPSNNREVEIEVYSGAVSGAGVTIIGIYDGIFGSGGVRIGGGNITTGNGVINARARHTPTAGAKTYTATISSTSGNPTFGASATGKSWLAVTLK